MYSRSQLSIRHFSYYGLPKYSRIKTISKLLNVTAKKVAEHIGIHQKGKGRYLCCYDHEWYQFQSANDIIIPFHIAQKYASYHKKKFHYLDFYNLPSACSSDNDKENIQRVPVIALLGHFNHGKTTLLDLFAKSNYVSKESHGITQEIRTKYVQLTNGEGKEYGVTLVDTPGQEIFYRMRNYGFINIICHLTSTRGRCRRYGTPACCC